MGRWFMSRVMSEFSLFLAGLGDGFEFEFEGEERVNVLW